MRSNLISYLARVRIGICYALRGEAFGQTYGIDDPDAAVFQAISELRAIRDSAYQNNTSGFDFIRFDRRLKPWIEKCAATNDSNTDGDYLEYEGDAWINIGELGEKEDC